MTDTGAGPRGRLAGKVAIVTGGATGIGAAVCAVLAAEGAAVGLLDVAGHEGAATSERIAARTGRPVRFHRCDVTDEDAVAAAVRAVHAEHGRLDVLVNNAGVNAYFDATTMTQADWDGVFAVDLKGAWLCAKYALVPMREQGSGSIVNIASVHARMTTAGMFPYAAAKAGLVGLTRSLALDHGPHGIRVNAVSPGWTRTRLVAESFARLPDPVAAERAVTERLPLRRMADPLDVARVVAFVASDEAANITGADLAVDGGMSAMYA